MRRIGLLTGGGDCPGLNAVIRGAVTKGIRDGYEMVGIKDGWKGVMECLAKPLTLDDVEDIHIQGGTILGTSRTNPAKYFNKGKTKEDQAKGYETVIRNMKEMDLYALIAVGGNDTLSVAKILCNEEDLASFDIPKEWRIPQRIVGVPKTIDNDLSGTDYTFGFDTAINMVMEALDKLHTTARSHHRILVVEIMGRDAGWITLEGGMSGGAHVILLPEENLTMTIDEVCRILKRRLESGKDYSIVAVSEGVRLNKLFGRDLSKDEIRDILAESGLIWEKYVSYDVFGNPRLGEVAGKVLATEISKRLKVETRSVVLGHLQRGGSPSAFDRYLGTRLGIRSVQAVEDGDFGKMIALRGRKLEAVPLEEAVEPKIVTADRYEDARLFMSY
ncbi:MAG: 6-phosphofructokinase [bacterium]